MDSDKTLPASWFTSQKLYELERRGVFFKSWYLVGPVTRFASEPVVGYEFAGVAINVEHHGDENFTVTRLSDVRGPQY